ncbi:glycosyltransferase family 2 protein [Candidatus Uhrbacteria bacterium]|nr:glycosyltransferase family 2 protein [Candidatus Uhrbacteria bacterium]
MAHVAVNIVAWNSMRHLPETLASIAAQTHKDLSLMIIDNASSDDVLDFVRSEYPQAMILRNTQNTGFSRAHNQGIAHVRAHCQDPENTYVLVTNPDIVLEPNYVEVLVSEMSRRSDVGSGGGKILKLYPNQDELGQGLRSGRFDSTGLKVTRGRRVADRAAGEEDAGAHDRTEEVFGVSGALAMYRVSALDDVALNGEYFDEDFFAYKEDVDIAWRLRLRGWKSLYVPGAVAHHYRTAAGRDRASKLETAFNPRRRLRHVNFYSYRNHLLTLVKNEHVGNFLRDMPRIGWYEFQKFAFVACLEQRTMKGLVDFFRRLPRAYEKRRLIMSRATVRPGEIRKWFA